MKRNTIPATGHATWARHAVGAVGAVLLTGTLGAGCLTRPVVRAEPITKLNFTTQVNSQSIDKVDILFMVDNSSSMGDKQNLLVDVVPDLLGRLVAPYCVDPTTLLPDSPPVPVQADGTCADATKKAEFPAVHNMHVGVVTSSIGDAGAQSACKDSVPRQNDHAYLWQEDKSGGNIAEASDNNGFLAWFPSVKANASATPPSHPITATGNTTDTTGPGLFGAFSDVLGGVLQTGCGFEAQLESWYRFLIQPDPYASIDDSNINRALQGVDKTILQQRHDFLRPDSLVAVIVLTDENDSTVDPMALSGTSWFFEDISHGAPRGTSECATNPEGSSCQNCALSHNTTDSACAKGQRFTSTPQGSVDDPADGVNERFFHMKQRFGIDPQFPVSRYSDGLSNTAVPNRDGEHPPLKGGGVQSTYADNKNCTNPLFASALPDGSSADDPAALDATGPLCKLPVGARQASQIFFATIGGVPWQLLTTDPTDANAPFKDTLSDDDWTHLIGKDPLNYDFSSADPHMLESETPRAGIPSTNDPYGVVEWDTSNPGFLPGIVQPNDLEYACTFSLTDFGFDRVCGATDASCDCKTGSKAPLCDKANPLHQIRAKAYPTLREFSVVRSLGAQGIAASLCPRSADKSNQYYGYRPAVSTIVKKLGAALNSACVPQKLIPDPNNNNNVPCLVLVTLFQTPGGEDVCTSDPNSGLSVPDADVLKKFRENAEAAYVAANSVGNDPANYPVCELQQLTVAAGTSCIADFNHAGWCYVENTAAQGANGPAGLCGQSVFFTPSGTIPGGLVNLQCVEQNNDEGGEAGATTTSATDGG